MRLYERPLIRSAITMLSVDLTHAAEVLLQYLSLFPSDISMTVYGLDASFKAFFFVWKYMREKWRIMDTASLFVAGRQKRPMIHFVVEATWTTNQVKYLLYVLVYVYKMYVCIYVWIYVCMYGWIGLARSQI